MVPVSWAGALLPATGPGIGPPNGVVTECPLAATGAGLDKVLPDAEPCNTPVSRGMSAAIAEVIERAATRRVRTVLLVGLCRMDLVTLVTIVLETLTRESPIAVMRGGTSVGLLGFSRGEFPHVKVAFCLRNEEAFPQ